MKAKQYLMQVQKLDSIIENKIQESLKWKSVATNITPVYGGGDGGHTPGNNQQKMECAIVKYIGIEEELSEVILKCQQKKNEISRTIEALPPNEYDVLHKVYVQHNDFNSVADAKGKSYSWVISVHGIALKHLQKILDERGEQE